MVRLGSLYIGQSRCWLPIDTNRFLQPSDTLKACAKKVLYRLVNLWALFAVFAATSRRCDATLRWHALTRSELTWRYGHLNRQRFDVLVSFTMHAVRLVSSAFRCFVGGRGAGHGSLASQLT
jgi:hypothetical protein